MVGNLLETGTPFDYKAVDFSKRKSDANKASAPTIQVGEQDIPDRDIIFIDKGADDDMTFEDE